MSYKLVERTEEYVENFWYASKDEELREVFPFMDFTLDESLEMYRESLKPHSTSLGRSILVDDLHIGDIWCYSIDETVEKSCFLSIVIFNKDYWKKGIGHKAIDEFIRLINRKYRLDKICAFTYKDNKGSIGVLEKSGFICKEAFSEDGRESLYFEMEIIR